MMAAFRVAHGRLRQRKTTFGDAVSWLSTIRALRRLTHTPLVRSKMSFFTPRQAQAGLLHLVIWGLLAVLLFTQPNSQLPASRFYLLQTVLLGASMGVFYGNVNWAVPHLLYQRRLPAYLLFVGVAVLGISLVHRGGQLLLQTAAARPMNRPLPPAGPPPNQFPPNRLPPGPPAGRGGVGGYGLNPAVLLSTLLVLGLGNSVAAVQRSLRDAHIRQEIEQEKLTTELLWLKAQINPHFFFNTLNNIYMLTLLDGGEQARTAIYHLARMMRYVLYETQNNLAPLSQEVQFVRDYVDLMQLRLTDNVRVTLDIPVLLHEDAIAPLLLLVFVENAFKHGVSTEEPSSISIVLRQPAPKMLEVTVRNTVFENRPVALDYNHGLGLTNARRRLALLYPGRHTLTVTERTPEHEYYVHLVLQLDESSHSA